MASLLTRLFGLPRHERDARFDRSRASILPTPDTRPIATPSPSETPSPVNNWCHPLKATQNPLEQLTHLANATAGYYPIGRSGLFHGGVHFDSATGVTQDQAVHCLADGEVVAFRVDTHSPMTRYFIDTLTVDKPFARNFVLVRHRLQPPKIHGSAKTPPSLTFYSLYMHLRDSAKYQEDSTLPRPAHWPQSPTLRVKQTVTDVLAEHPEPGLNVRHEDGGKVIDLLPRGASVTVSGNRNYRKLEDRLAPSNLINADGSVVGYIAASRLHPIEGNQHRITSSEEWVNVRAEPKFGDNVIAKLPTRSIVTVSGDGPFRKLERVNQYVHFKSLERVQEPEAVDRIVVLEQPVPIKAGELIGHLGDYQDSGADWPEQKLHLEVFSGDDIDEFFDASRAWAERLPDKDKTWLKFAKGTAVVAHQEHMTGGQLSAMRAESPLSAADLLVPKSLLEGLPAERKIHVPGDHDRKARNWYRLDNLLHDADDNLLNGWVCEEVGVTPWLSPWAWDGYEVLYDYSLPKHAMASFFSAVNRFNEPQRERFRNLTDIDHQGRMKTRLYDIIDPHRTGNMTADELQAALRLPAKAQEISKLVLRMESEWFYQEQKWDALDELLGHCGSTPHLNWVAEKERIKQMSWWGEVAEKVGLPVWGRPYHFHPVGLVGSFCATIDENDLIWLTVPYGQLTFDVEGNDIEDPKNSGHRYFSRKAHWPGGSSGVTIGRGYDLGQRPTPQADLLSAGISEPLLSWLIGAKGLKGQAAKAYMDSASVEIKSTFISRKQQYDLFIPIYEFMKDQVLRISRKEDVVKIYGDVYWDDLNEKIRDVTIDLIYRGNYTGETRKIIQLSIAENDLPGFSEAMCARENWPSVPSDRFNKRSQFMRSQ
ncbi:pesticin C-terminus-like muramidase [Pseudomonas baetica]|uniref:pesticin C-terminus-like muramidase n=1 Tax=Pseudomonas baetica TaxID=674054 RepID=UPI003EEC954A